MPVESAADLASFFHEDEFAEAAQYTAPGVGVLPVSCTIIVDRGQGRQQFDAGRQEIDSLQRLVQAQSGELPSVERDGVFALLDAEGEPSGERFKVAGRPKLDHASGVWSAQVVLVR